MCKVNISFLIKRVCLNESSHTNKILSWITVCHFQVSKTRTSFFFSNLKSDSHLPKKVCIICFIESLSKVMKNASYFILKALFVFNIFKFLS